MAAWALAQRSASEALALDSSLAEAYASLGEVVYYTEWNTSADPRDPLHDEPYAAAFVTKTVMEASPLVQGYGFPRWEGGPGSPGRDRICAGRRQAGSGGASR